MKLAHLLSETFLTNLSREDMESLTGQFAFGLGRQIYDDLLPLDDGLIVQVFSDAIEVSGTSGEVRIGVSDSAITVGDAEKLDVSSNPSLGEVGGAMIAHRKRQDSVASKGLSDQNLLQRVEEMVKRHLGLA